MQLLALVAERLALTAHLLSRMVAGTAALASALTWSVACFSTPIRPLCCTKTLPGQTATPAARQWWHLTLQPSRQLRRHRGGQWHVVRAPLRVAAGGMRQLVDLLNSIAGSAARLPSSLPPSSSAGIASVGLPGSQQPIGAALGSDTGSSLQSRGGMGGPFYAAGPPPPLSPAAAAALPALRAAEAALEAKLANDGAVCTGEYVRLHLLNERFGAQRSFSDAEACRPLNRWADCSQLFSR